MRVRVLAALAAASLLTACGGRESASEISCHVAAYRLTDGRIVDIAPTEGAALRWRLLDGRTGRLERGEDGAWTSTQGWTEEPDGVPVSFGVCEARRIHFAGVEGRAAPLTVADTRFDSGDVTLAGRLVLPPGDAPVPVLVIGHGSEKDSAVVWEFRQRLFAAEGVGVFVFDKRGTGASDGKYTQDFEVLAGDVAAAVAEARRLAGGRASRVGLEGGSQAGWVLPLAATMTSVDFVVVGYGVAASPLLENRTETVQDLAAAGWNAEVQSKGAEIADAAGAVMASDFKAGFDRLNALKRRYGEEPWFKDLKGEFTGDFVRNPEIGLRVAGPFFDQGTTWNHDAVGVLRRVEAPLLWMLAGADTGGAGAETREALLALKAAGRPITVVDFPGTEHGIVEFKPGPDGEPVETRYAEGYFALELDFIRNGALAGPYGRAQVLEPGPRTGGDP